MALLDVLNSPRRIDDLEEEVEDLKGQIEDLRKRVDGEDVPSEDIESLSKKVESIEAERRSLIDSVSKLDERVSSIEESSQIDADELQSIRDRLDSMETYDDTEIQKRIDELDTQLSDLGDLSGLRDRVSSLEETVSDDEDTLRVDSVSTTVSESVHVYDGFDIRGYLVKGDEDGPTAMVIGGLHGDETVGVHYATDLVRRNPIKGDMYVIPRASGPATLSSNRTLNGTDLNRAFPRGQSPNHEITQAIWETYNSVDPDVVIDLHSSSGIEGMDDGGVGQAVWSTDNASDEGSSTTSWVNARSIDPEKWSSNHKWTSRGNQSSGSGVSSFTRKLGSDTSTEAHLIEVTRKGVTLEKQYDWLDVLVRKLLENHDIYL